MSRWSDAPRISLRLATIGGWDGSHLYRRLIPAVATHALYPILAFVIPTFSRGFFLTCVPMRHGHCPVSVWRTALARP